MPIPLVLLIVALLGTFVVAVLAIAAVLVFWGWLMECAARKRERKLLNETRGLHAVRYR